MKDISADIELFIGHFKKDFTHVQTLAVKDAYHQGTYKKMIYMGILDALSKCIYPKRGNRDRMVHFLDEFSGWEGRKRLSLPHLYQLLQKNPEPSFSNLRKYIIEKLSQWASGELVTLDRDLEIAEVKKHWPKDKDQKKTINEVTYEALLHSQLFYSYRNSLIHEFREPGHGVELKNDKEPFYLSMSYLEEPEVETWELVYPLGFFEKIVEDCISNLEQYLRVNNINPYKSYIFGSYWIDELNQ